jgi:hypothetical protein
MRTWIVRFIAGYSMHQRRRSMAIEVLVSTAIIGRPSNRLTCA